ncbi:MAG: hypothetical protein HOP23_02775 [Methylococcaceae bacterium]|nr:hypothetical protein [Methylococcaceae bacterium]
MKQTTMIGLSVLFISLITSTAVSASGGHHGGGWRHGHGWRGGYYGGFGLGFYGWPPFYNYPPVYAYPPAIVTVPASPPVYIQQTPPMAQPNASGYWYYCFSPEGYYPYIKECPGGWQQVNPAPPAPR